MPVKLNIPDKMQIRLTSAAELMRASLEPYLLWIEQTIGVPLGETVTVEVDSNPGDVIAGQLLDGLPLTSGLSTRTRDWRRLIEQWLLPSGVSPRMAASSQRERQPQSAHVAVWNLDWQDCLVAFKLKGLARHVVGVKVSPGRLTDHNALIRTLGDRPP
jgi:hypothetical protein